MRGRDREGIKGEGGAAEEMIGTVRLLSTTADDDPRKTAYCGVGGREEERREEGS